jgi:CubicO group peptidase (beta-lactamase class C family)
MSAVPWLLHADNVRFEQYIESLRQQTGIPGLSAAVVQDGATVWDKGFGLADVEENVAARGDTPYPIAGLTASLSAVEALQCVDEGQFALETHAVEFGAAGEEPSTLRDVLGHLVPGPRFAFDLGRFEAVAAAVKSCTRQTLRMALAERIFDRLAMTHSVPGHDFANWSSSTRAQFSHSALDRYARAMGRLAKGYRTNGRSRPTPSTVAPSSLTASTGAVSTARDLADFQVALDRGVLVDADTLRTAWTRPMLHDGRLSPHALGWFAQVVDGQLLIWQFGVIRNTYSSLLLTLPQQRTTLILLANSDGLVDASALAKGDISASPFARLFVRLFS